MNKRLLIIATLIAGFAFACATGDPLINEARDQIQSQNFDEAISAAERALEENSENPLAHYFKAVALGSKAEDMNPPSSRKEVYEEMKSSFNSAHQFADRQEERPEEIDNIPTVLNTIWAQEHNSAVQILTDDSVRAATPTPSQTAIAHLENAVTIQPDSSLSYIVLSSAHFQENNVDEAISNYEKAMEIIEAPEIEDYDYLISLYLNQSRFEQARDLSEEAVEAYPDETNFVRYLADSYLQMGETDRAMQIVRNLIQTEPDNPQYRMVLGTQIYQLVTEKNEEISSKYNQLLSMKRQATQLSGEEQENVEVRIRELENEVSEMEQEINELTNTAIEEVEKVTELVPNDDNAHNILGIIYQNKAATLFEKRNSIVDDNELASEYDEQARETLRKALVYYEKAAEINPDETEYWQALFQVYTTLGMEEEAREAMEKADLQ